MACTFDKPYKCTKCFSTFSRSASLKCHLKTHVHEDPEKFSNDEDNTSDISSNLKNPPNSVKALVNSHETPSSNFKYLPNNVKKQNVLSTSKRPHKCTHCSAAFRAADNLERHLRTHTGEKPYKCLYCSKTFDMLIALRRHQCTISGKGPYKCAQCNSTFMHANALKEHVKVHSGRKPEKCMYCQAIFYEIRTLTQHLKTHTDDKFKKCVYCNGVFHSTRSLKLHLRAHTDEELNKCTPDSSGSIATSSQTPDKDVLKIHLYPVNECQKEVHRCSFCNARFAHLRTLNAHLRMHIGDEYLISSASSAETNKRFFLHISENPNKLPRYHYDDPSSHSNNLERALGTNRTLTSDYDAPQLDPNTDPLQLPLVKCEIPDEDLDYSFSTSSGDYVLLNQDIKVEVKEENLE